MIAWLHRYSLSYQPLALRPIRGQEPKRLPESSWEGWLQLAGRRPQAVRIELATGGQHGVFSASLEGVGGGSGRLEQGEVSSCGAVKALLTAGAELGLGPECPRRLEGRCVVDGLQRATLVLASAEGPDRQGPDVRLTLRSNSRVLSLEHGALTIDGPILVYRGVAATPKYLMHTARSPWTQQIATDYLVAELVVQQLSPSKGAGGLVVGVADLQPGGSAEPLGHWPDDAKGRRWLWRSDGSICHSLAGEQRSALWRFGPGDSVGFAVGPSNISFLRNGDVVHRVPRRVRGEKSGSKGAPVLVVGLNSDAVLCLCEGVQYLHLCEDPATARSKPGEAEAPCGPRPLAGGQRPDRAALRRRFRAHARAVDWLVRLSRKTFKGPMPWGPLVAPERRRVSPVAATLSTAAKEQDVWVESTFVGTTTSFSKDLSPVDEVGGEPAVKELVASFFRSSSRPHDELARAEASDVRELFVNELTPLDGQPFSSAKVSARLRRGAVESFCQANLERDGECWKVVDMLPDGSGKGGLCAGLRHVPPGAEVVAMGGVEPGKCEGGWIKVAGGERSRALWLPVRTPGPPGHCEVTRLVRKGELGVRETPVFARAATRHFPATATGARLYTGSVKDYTDDLTATGVKDLPAGAEPYTVEACVRVHLEDSGREMCIVAWGDERARIDHGLALRDVLVSVSCSLKGSKKACDGQWHHVACTFDGKERRLWTDFELAACDAPEPPTGGGGSPRRDNLSVGSYPSGHAELLHAHGNFRGDMKMLRIWKAALTPAELKAYALTADAQVREEITIEAIKAVYAGVDVRSDGSLAMEDLDAVFGGAKASFFRRLDRGDRGFVSCDDWIQFCRELREARGEQDLMQFLQACARNLGQRRRPLQVSAKLLASSRWYNML